MSGKFNRITPLLGGRAALVSGCALVATGVVEIIHSQRTSGSRVVGVPGHLVLAFMVVALAAMAPAVIALSRYGRSRAAERAGIAAAAGTVLVAGCCTVSLIKGSDPALFPVFASIGSALWLGGLITIAVSLKRAGRVAPFVALALPVTWILSLPLGTLGGGVAAGAYFLVVGHLMAGGAIGQPVAPAVAAA